MKKIIFISLAFMAICLSARAQSEINIYQEDFIIKTLPVSQVDSVTVTESEPRTICLWHNGNVFLTYSSEEVDSITLSRDGEEPLSYIGIIGFNDELHKKDIDILSTNTASQYKSFVNSLPRRDGTLLYYAVDNAIDMLAGKEFTTPLTSVNMITFTDGLDQGSVMMNRNYSSSSAYLAAMNRRIGDTRIKGLPLNAYTVGLRGNDVSDIAMFQNNLNKLASSSEKAFEVSSINDLRSKLQDIANQIISVNTTQTISVKVPGADSGTRSRFVFDGKPAESSELYIEGTFSLSDLALHNVSYHGMKARSGSTVQGTQDGIFVTFTLRGLQREDGDGLIPMSNIKHYYRQPSSSSWQMNSEFSPTNNTLRGVNHKGTAIMLVLDCSSSLGSEFSSMKSYANDFIDLVAGNTFPCNVETPKNVKATLSIDNDKLVVHLDWDKEKYAESYDIYRSGYDYYNDECIASDVTTDFWIDETPLNGGNYYMVVAKGHGLTSYKSNYAYVSYILEAPKNVLATFDDNNFVVNVSWDAVNFAKRYHVYRSNSSNGTYSLVAENVSTTSWKDTNPLNGYNYYKVRAFGYGLASSQSNSVYANVFLDAPTNINVMLDNENLYVNVTWSEVANAQTYNIYRNSSSTGTYSLIGENISSLSWTDQLPLSGTNYYYVRSVSHGYMSTQSPSSYINVNLDVPKNLNAVIDDKDLFVNLSWDKVQRAKYYKIYRSSNSSGTYDLVADRVESNFWTDVAPMAGTNYYKICAFSGNVISTRTSYVSVNIQMDTPSGVIADLDDSEFAVNVSWDEVKYAQSYSVYRCSSPNGTYVLMDENIKATTWTDRNPLEGNNYYKVSATGYGLTSSNSSYAQIYISLGVPENVKVELVIKDDRLVTCVSWDAVKYAKSYSVYKSSSYNGTYTLVADNITSNTWFDMSPLNGNNYYKIRAKNNDYESVQSDYGYVNYNLDTPQNVKSELGENDLVVVVSWDAVDFAQQYNVYCWDKTSLTYTIAAQNITSTSWTDIVPDEGENRYVVTATGYGLTSSQSIYTSTTVKLDAPMNVIAELDAKDLCVNVSWNAVKYAQSYCVYRCESANGTYILMSDNVESNTWTDCNPLRGNNYYKVCSVNRNITSAQSSYAYIVVKLDAPMNVIAVLDAKDLCVNVSWDAVKFAQSYNVYRSNSSNGTYSLIAEGVSTTSWKDTNPLKGYNYYKVSAVGYGLTSSQSNSTYANVFLDAPANITATLDDYDLIVNVSWDAVKNAQSYNVYRSNSSSGTYELIASDLKTTSWTDNNPLGGNNYYKVCAKSHGITSDQSRYATVNVKLEAPTHVNAVLDDNDLIVRVTWDVAKYALSYDVYRSNSSSGTYEIIASDLSSTSWTDNNPLDGNNYYKVISKGYGLTSSQSSYALVNVAIAAPANVQVELDDNELIVHVSWEASKYASNYDVYRSATSSGAYELVAENITATSWTDNTPLGGNNYFKVCAKRYNYKSSQSSYVSIFISLEAPKNLKAEYDENSEAVTISWDAVRYAKSYNVYRSNSSSGTFKKVAENVSSTTWTDNSLLNWTCYYKVSAVNDDLESIISNVVFVQMSKASFIVNVNGVTFKMIGVDAGTFRMGATSEQGSDADIAEKSAHNVTLSDYWIGETEVTQALWEAVMGSNPSMFMGSNRPVNQVSWDDCQTFVNKLNSLLSSQLPDGRKFRLPTEAEWEYAARGGNKAVSQTKYAGSNNIDDVAWYRDNSYAKGRGSLDYGSQNVATKSPNALGIYDMSGNVQEWCQDWYYGLYSSSPQLNPTGPTSGSYRVCRGGCWIDDARYCRVSCRYSDYPSGSSYTHGLRLAL